MPAVDDHEETLRFNLANTTFSEKAIMIVSKLSQEAEHTSRPVYGPSSGPPPPCQSIGQARSLAFAVHHRCHKTSTMVRHRLRGIGHPRLRLIFQSSTSTAMEMAHPTPSPLAFASLPPELFDTLIEHVSPEERQRAALALRQVFPDDRISSRHLWTYMVIRRPQQLFPLWQRLKAESKLPGGGHTRDVIAFCMESWKGDADILNKWVSIIKQRLQSTDFSAMRLLPDVKILMMNIGTNFAPEHLEEMFDEPRTGIRRMEMRFRPYVEQAMYYQFLKGTQS